MIVVLATAGVVVFVAFLISTFNDANSARTSARNDLTTLADVIAQNSASAIIFDDVGAATETLDALEADNSILSANILNKQGDIFASYINTHHEINGWAHQLTIFETLVIERPIVENKRQIGAIRVTADYDHVFAGVVLRMVTNSIGIFIAFLVGYFFLKREVRSILEPVERLTSTISKIISHQQYSLRVKKVSSDELGNLTESFNLMLAQIELRDAKLRQSDEALSQTLEAIALLDENLQYQYINPAFVTLFGYQLEEFSDTPFSLLPKKDNVNALTRDEIFSIAINKGSYRGELMLETKSGQLLPISLHVSPIKSDLGEITGYVSVASDISEKKQAEEWILRQANYDLVTSLPNRHMFHQRLEAEVSNSKLTGEPFALMFLDLDDFKEVNDSIGHDMGDLLLKEVGIRLLNCLRITDTVGREGTIARLGGDEFTILLSQFKSDENVNHVAQRILEVLTQPFHLGAYVMSISASIGITIYPRDAEDAESLIKNADQTMYDAKNKGRNTYSFFTPAIQEASAKRREMTHDLRVAIEQNQFRLEYQPIIDLTTNKIHKAEALLRWDHPQSGLVSPVDFIPVAEKAGLIVDIGNWVFFQVADQLAEWRKTIDHNFQISINKSPVQFYDKTNKHMDWFDYLNELGIPGSSLVVEITEGLMLDKNPEVSEKLLAFRDSGIQVAVDDFGTGYSSLSYLKKFDVDYIKIDQSFMRNLTTDSEDMILCEAIIVMAHKLGLKVIAEGIETIEQRDLLVSIGCDYGQGYFFSKPAAADVIKNLCIKQNQVKSNVHLIKKSFLEAS
jgi:diguanylate cyclase (GGDEF)-like protein/PAS domain S-box-containing protein